jgi:hypothetical protein
MTNRSYGLEPTTDHYGFLIYQLWTAMSWTAVVLTGNGESYGSIPEREPEK